MSKVLNVSSSTAAAEPQTPAPTPEQVVEQLRALRASLPEVAPLTPEQRRAVRNAMRVPPDVLHAQIDVIGASDRIEAALGQPSDEVRQLADEHSRWLTVENELKALLSGVAGGNLIRAQRLRLLGSQAYAIGTSLAKSPTNSDLVPHVAEVRRLKRIATRRKAAPQTPAPDTPSPEPQPQSQPPSDDGHGSSGT
jgi:hypothetical protein